METEEESFYPCGFAAPRARSYVALARPRIGTTKWTELPKAVKSVGDSNPCSFAPSQFIGNLFKPVSFTLGQRLRDARLWLGLEAYTCQNKSEAYDRPWRQRYQ